LFTKGDVATDSVDLNQVVRDVIALSAAQLRRSRVTVRADLAEGLPEAAGDRVQLQQVVMNLLVNAADAMSGSGDRAREVTIRTKCGVGESVRVSVSDAGVGIGPDGIERLFSPFYSTKAGGMGIGLAISRSIVESHRGRLWATPNIGPGATFEFSIPCRRTDVGVPGAATGANAINAPNTAELQ
jgi:signal transduction histidine kinase